MFLIAGCYKQRCLCIRENINIVKSGSKYLNDITKDSNIDKYADLIIEYLDQFKLDYEIEIYKIDSR